MPKRETKQQIIDRQAQRIASLESEASRFHERLTEARRRTIPMRNGGDYNFLPGYISDMRFDNDVKTLHGYDGIPHHVISKATVTIVCDGELVAIPSYPEPRKKPAPELGWKILNEYADKIIDRDLQGCFIADARTLESGFTSGELSEDIYRTMLRMLMPKE